jgi:bifunctional DNase/RNase
MSDPYVEVKIENVSYVMNMGYIVFLRRENDDQILPICVGKAEAQAIAAACGETEPPVRPMTHDWINNVLTELHCTITKVRVTELKDGTFFGRVYFRDESGKEHDMDSRPSDGIAMALRQKAPLFVHAEVLEEASVSVNQITRASQPKRTASDDEAAADDPIDPIRKLQLALDKAVSDERYEEAARLRDELQTLIKQEG